MPGAIRVPDAAELERRRIVGIHAETVDNVTSTDFPHHYIGEDNSWDIEHFRKNVKVNFHSNQPLDAVFSVIGIDASVANAFRRILIAEIPTVAIEDVFVWNNTSIIQDEVLCHRIGLIPFTGSREGLRRMTRFRKEPKEDDPAARDAAEKTAEVDDPEELTPTDNNTVIVKLKVECTWAEDGKKLAKGGERDPNKLYVNSSVYSRQFTFEPVGNQHEHFASPGEIKPVNGDILIAKLRPGQKIDLICHCIKGIGADHAKFSPVATASYRLLPAITIKQPILGADAKKFARCFPRGVIELEDDKESGQKKAVVKDTMKDTVSRECLRHDEFKDKISLGRIRDHFIFSVESTGQIESDDLFIESVKLLKEKALRFKQNLLDLTS